MNPLFDAPRTLSITGAALPSFNGAPILVPTKLSGSEAVGELFEYILELKTADTLAFSPSIGANVDLAKLAGSEVTVLIQIEGKGHFIPGRAGDTGQANIGAGTREITGIVSTARIVREETRAFVYELTLRPWPWHAAQNNHTRNFQDMSVVEITDAVLSAYPFPVDKRLTTPRPNPGWPKRDIQRQHRESDWTFLQRVWQEWGIFWFFEHSDGKHRLVLCDSMGALKSHAEPYQTIRYQAPGAQHIDEEYIHALTVTNTLTPGAVTAVDYDYTWPRADLTVTREDPRDTALAHQAHYTWGDYAQPQAGAAGLSGDHNAPRTEAEYLTMVRMQALRCPGLRAQGAGNLRGLVAGRTFVLTHYPQTTANREYLVVSSKLTIEEVGEASGSGQRYQCQAEFEVQPANEAFRLQRTIPKPSISGPEYAVVTGPENQEIWTDAYGRVKVQFIWDKLSPNDERSSCWVRVLSPWQGDQFGATHLPRRGQEVAVIFYHGDPDLPVIVASAVNAFNMSSAELPQNHALAITRSKEIDGRRANTIALDDTHGKIQAHLSSDEGDSQLNLGFITRIAGHAGRQEERGRGFELVTNLWGVMRSALGMLITTHGHLDAQGQVKDMSETVRQLEDAQRLHDAMSRAAQAGGAQDAEGHQSDLAKAIEAQNQQIHGVASASNPFRELSEPHLAIAGKAGVEIVTPATVHVAAQQVAVTSEGHVGIAGGRSLFVTVCDTMRMFVQRGIMKFIAASGDIMLQALTESIIQRAQKQILLQAEEIVLRAKKIRLEANDSFTQYDDKGITHGTAGEFVAHAARHDLPTPIVQPVDTSPKHVCTECLLRAAKSGASVVPL
jgi:type VI secretion system VgrG family protein